ncbi:hypothetical protein [uncultured Flavobacterium sp.]|uniref:hypothetical protein n=1 Tax=uncultured Flavobacterium sp. TaxID=165435 RepID=UPI0030CA15A9
MKKVSILFVSALILGIFFISRTKEDSGPVDMNLIAGKWLFNKSTATSGTFNLYFTK